MNKVSPCPASREVIQHPVSGEFVSICNLVLRRIEDGDKKYQSWEIPYIFCEHYQECPVWIEEKTKIWREKVAARRK